MNPGPNIRVIKTNDILQVQVPPTSLIADCIADYGGLQVQVLRLELAIGFFKLAIEGKKRDLHAVIAMTADFLNPKCNLEPSRMLVCPQMDITYSTIEHGVIISVKPVDNSQAIKMTLSDALLYSCTQALAVDPETTASQIVNHTGVPLHYWVGDASDRTGDKIGQVQPGEKGTLASKGQIGKNAADTLLHVTPLGYTTCKLPVTAVGESVQLLQLTSEPNAPPHPFVFINTLENGVTKILASGAVRVDNTSGKPFEVLSMVDASGTLCGVVEARSSLHLGVPLSGRAIRLRVAGQTAVSAPIMVSAGATSTNVVHVALDFGEGYHLNVSVSTRGAAVVVTLSAALELQNLLPCGVAFIVHTATQTGMNTGSSKELVAMPGKTAELFELNIAATQKFVLQIKLDTGSGWLPGQAQIDSTEENNIIEFSHKLLTLVKLRVVVCFVSPTCCEIFSHYWVCNRTGFPLSLRTSGWDSWPHGTQPDAETGDVFCVEMKSMTELQVAVPGSEYKAVKVSELLERRLQLWSPRENTTYDFHLAVDFAAEPFERTRVVTIRPMVALVNRLPAGLDFSFRGKSDAGEVCQPMVVAGGGRTVHLHPCGQRRMSLHTSQLAQLTDWGPDIPIGTDVLDADRRVATTLGGMAVVCSLESGTQEAARLIIISPTTDFSNYGQHEDDSPLSTPNSTVSSRVQLHLEFPKMELEVCDMTAFEQRYKTEPINHAKELAGELFRLDIWDMIIDGYSGDDLELSLSIGGLRVIDAQKNNADGVILESGVDLGANIGGAVGIIGDVASQGLDIGALVLNTVTFGGLGRLGQVVDAVESRVIHTASKLPSTNRPCLAIQLVKASTAVGAAARTSFREFQVVVDGGLKIVINDLQILRLLATQATVLNHLSPSVSKDPNSVVVAMQAPLVTAADQEVGAALFFKHFLLAHLECRIDFRRDTNLGKKLFKVGKGLKADGLALSLPAVEIEELLGTGSTVKDRLVQRYRGPITRQVLGQLLALGLSNAELSVTSVAKGVATATGLQGNVSVGLQDHGFMSESLSNDNIIQKHFVQFHRCKTQADFEQQLWHLLFDWDSNHTGTSLISTYNRVLV
jgi:hypothetical protein